ncbi:CopG family ribbon-helix-helix protein [Methyloprofundus sp.]|uniref:CopG family ribbon-helix-helix protein n=1 Tax=Methyloprofundus sp. TaxID=2020875 RepID=UPI003D0FB11F
MSTVPFTFRIEKDLKNSLDLEAQAEERSSSYLASQAIKTMLEIRTEKKQAIEKAIVEADKGTFVSQKAVHQWMDSWDTENELDKPKADIFLKN